ncbi:exo-beta-N-acetylmuramidase NamZ domain-containing protein [Georgenia sp. MJ206]|uniref:exo-beta-N-acetylmuramidase NamZ domain-containing protein n=1 Tax=Georgenia wangjunii TaxID=3117730 RepID=UPI002F265B22
MSRAHRRRGLAGATAGLLLLATMTPAAAAVDEPSQHGVDIDAIVSGMTLEEKVGQMFVPYMYGSAIDEQDNRNIGPSGVRSIGEMIDEFHPGGLIYFGWSNNLNSPGQVAQLSNDIQERATAGDGIPMTLSIDQEEGVVVRLPQPSAQLPGAMALGATRNPEHARDAARITAEKLAAVGVNQDYSPLADVNSNAENPVIGVRAFGGDTALVSSLVAAQVRGFQDDGGISASVKHFPGHGDTAVDSHYGVPLIDKSEEEFRAEDLPPFQAAIDAGTDSIMTAHIVVPALDPSGRPATFSRPILTDLLREEMGFDGVIVTDALNMQGARDEFGDERVPVEAILAGADQMLMPPNLRVAYDGVMDAVESGEITEERIEESVHRILEQKAKRGLLEDAMVDLDAVDDVMATPEHYATSAAIADDSITLLSNDGVLPLADGAEVFLTGWGGAARLDAMAAELTAHGADVTTHPAAEPGSGAITTAVNASAGHDAVVVLTQSGTFAPTAPQQALVAALADGDVPVAQVSVRNPYDVAHTAETDAAIAAYSYADVSLQATARVLMGEVDPEGRLPVMVPTADGSGELFALGHGLRYSTLVTPDPVVFTDRSGTDADVFTVPATEGVVYQRDGETVAAGAHPGSGEVTITAVPAEGYSFAWNVETSWTHTFDPEERTPTVRLGVEVLVEDQLESLAGKRVGLITNPTGVDSELTHTMDVLIANQEEGDYELTALYAPEHGILGGAPAGANVESYVDPRTGLAVWSLYGATQRPTAEMLEDVDVLLFDIQDIGARFYTYIWTMYYAIDAAGEYGKDFMILDRPNPLGDRMDGAVLDPALSSFVGLREIPMQHGLTVGELGLFFNTELVPNPVENFSVVEMDGYDPADFVDGYGLEWVLPSPNIPTLETAWAYAGTGLVESINASEGRGTTKPFLWVGHSAIDEVEAYDLAQDLNSRGLEGVHFRPMFANPTTSKEAGRLSGGVEIHVTDPATYVPARTGLHLLDALFENIPEIDWREGTVYPTQRCETETDICWIDRLSGDRDVRFQLEAGVDPDEIVAGWQDGLDSFSERVAPYRLYAPASAVESRATTPTLRLGVEVLLEDQADVLAGKRVGLITNPTGVDSELTHTMDLLIAGEEEGDYELTALYAPEHGILGGAPAGASVESYVDPRTGLTVWSLYGATQRPTAEMLSDVDVLVFDIQDIGARFYTYIWSMYYAMDAAAEFGKDFVVLDRPNPLGDRMDGPVLDPALSSFVGLREIPMQHGLTAGELAALFNGEFLDEPVENFSVVEMDGYDPADFVEGYGLEWVLPSPNIPTLETAWAYAGTGLIESLDASEGRGTTKPFLWTGHGAIDEVEAYALAEDLNSRGLEGVHFRPMFANPTTSKQAGVLSGGVEIHITDPATYVPVRVGLHLVDALLHTEGVDWREGTIYPNQRCETESDTCWIDRLTGDKSVRMQLEAGVDPDEIIAGWADELAAFDALAEQYRLYSGEVPTGPEISVEAGTRCVVGRVVETVRVTNEAGVPVEVAITSPHGTRTVTIAEDRATSVAFSTRTASVDVGEVTAVASAEGVEPTTTVTATYDARACG